MTLPKGDDLGDALGGLAFHVRGTSVDGDGIEDKVGRAANSLSSVSMHLFVGWR